MSRARRAHAPHQPASYAEAVAQLQLLLRTEVKRSSALPTAVFDACDPMIETQLAQTTEAMLARLQEPVLPGERANGPGEQRLELVTADELRALPRLLVDDADEPPRLDAGISAEYLTVLADACRCGHEAAAAGARALLRRDYALPADAAPEAAGRVVTEALAEALLDGTIRLVVVAEHLDRIAAAILPPPSGPASGGGA